MAYLASSWHWKGREGHVNPVAGTAMRRELMDEGALKPSLKGWWECSVPQRQGGDADGGSPQKALALV